MFGRVSLATAGPFPFVRPSRRGFAAPQEDEGERAATSLVILRSEPQASVAKDAPTHPCGIV